MKRLIYPIILVCIGLLVIVGCEEDIDPTINLRDEYIGAWSANDKEGWNAPAFYEISIVAGSDPDMILIRGLYNLPDVELEAYINEYEVEIPTQMSDSITFAGTGKANVDFDQITFDYTANDGSGSDEVKTVCTRK